MIIPTKHQKLNENIIPIGAEIITSVRRKPKLVEDLFNEFKEAYKETHIDNFFLTLVFLWLIGAIKMEGDLITYK